MSNFVLQGGSKLIDISGGDIDRHAVFEKSCAIYARLNRDGFAEAAPELHWDRIFAGSSGRSH